MLNQSGASQWNHELQRKSLPSFYRFVTVYVPGITLGLTITADRLVVISSCHPP
jgi:hypothetical protein